jgi:hypothetical protein
VRFNRGRKRHQSTDITLGISPQDLFLIFIQSPAVTDHKTVKRYIKQISSHCLVILKHQGKFVITALEIM